ncbi:HNH endonuclease signature motif containing protein [soil metagenome]
MFGERAAVADLDAALTDLQGLDTDTLSGDELAELLVGLHRETARLAALRAQVTAACATRERWRGDGARCGASWLVHRCGLSVAAANREVRLARRLGAMPATEAALAAGEITAEHVAVIAGVNRADTAELFARDEKMLVDAARELTWWPFRAAVRYWEQLAAPDRIEDDAETIHQRRRLHISDTIDDMTVLDALFDPLSGAIVRSQLEAIEHELFEADWAAAKAEHGEKLARLFLGRTPAQRRADALVEMARRSATAPADGRQPRPLFTILVDYPTFAQRVCELANRTVITPGQAARFIHDADIERIVFDGPSRVIDVGARTRCYSGALRRAIEVRDRACTHPLCDQPPDRCQIDHIDPYANGGPTTQDNGRLLCGDHNRLRQQPP